MLGVGIGDDGRVDCRRWLVFVGSRRHLVARERQPVRSIRLGADCSVELGHVDASIIGLFGMASDVASNIFVSNFGAADSPR